jgi:hypothetical protein
MSEPQRRPEAARASPQVSSPAGPAAVRVQQREAAVPPKYPWALPQPSRLMARSKAQVPVEALRQVPKAEQRRAELAPRPAV